MMFGIKFVKNVAMIQEKALYLKMKIKDVGNVEIIFIEIFLTEL